MLSVTMMKLIVVTLLLCHLALAAQESAAQNEIEDDVKSQEEDPKNLAEEGHSGEEDVSDERVTTTTAVPEWPATTTTEVSEGAETPSNEQVEETNRDAEEDASTTPTYGETTPEAEESDADTRATQEVDDTDTATPEYTTTTASYPNSWTSNPWRGWIPPPPPPSQDGCQPCECRCNWRSFAPPMPRFHPQISRFMPAMFKPAEEQDISRDDAPRHGWRPRFVMRHPHRQPTPDAQEPEQGEPTTMSPMF